MARQHVPDAVLVVVERVVKRQRGAAGHAEDHVDVLGQDGFADHLAARAGGHGAVGRAVGFRGGHLGVLQSELKCCGIEGEPRTGALPPVRAAYRDRQRPTKRLAGASGSVIVARTCRHVIVHPVLGTYKSPSPGDGLNPRYHPDCPANAGPLGAPLTVGDRAGLPVDRPTGSKATFGASQPAGSHHSQLAQGWRGTYSSPSTPLTLQILPCAGKPPPDRFGSNVSGGSGLGKAFGRSFEGRSLGKVDLLPTGARQSIRGVLDPFPPLRFLAALGMTGVGVKRSQAGVGSFSTEAIFRRTVAPPSPRRTAMPRISIRGPGPGSPHTSETRTGIPASAGMTEVVSGVTGVPSGRRA